MKTDYLQSLNVVVERLLNVSSIQETIKALKMRLRQSHESFVWGTINIKPMRGDLPKNIRSAWIFVLRRNTPSLAHYHPNSVQYTVMIEGKGKAIIGGARKQLKLFNPIRDGKTWLVIGKNTSHEFFPEEQDMVVISFHTCLDDELIEIEADSGRRRLYRRVKDDLMKLKKARSLRMLPRKTRVRVLTHETDVDGLVSASLILRRFPNALVKTHTFLKEMRGEYDIIVDLPLLKSLKTHVWIDHHRGTIQEGWCREKVHDPSAKSAANLLAKYLNLKEDKLVGIANRADSASYLTDAPLGFKVGYDPAWDVNDAVKAITSSKRFVGLAKTLAFEGLEGVRKGFRAEISHTRALRRRAEEVIQMISKKVQEQVPDSMILLMPKAERRGSMIGGYIVFSLHRKGVKAFAVFYREGGCWIHVRSDFKKIDCSKVTMRYGGTGHRFGGGAPIGLEKLNDIKLEFEKAGMKPIIVDLRKLSW